MDMQSVKTAIKFNACSFCRLDIHTLITGDNELDLNTDSTNETH